MIYKNAYNEWNRKEKSFGRGKFAIVYDKLKGYSVRLLGDNECFYCNNKYLKPEDRGGCKDRIWDFNN